MDVGGIVRYDDKLWRITGKAKRLEDVAYEGLQLDQKGLVFGRDYRYIKLRARMWWLVVRKGQDSGEEHTR